MWNKCYFKCAYSINMNMNSLSYSEMDEGRNKSKQKKTLSLAFLTVTEVSVFRWGYTKKTELIDLQIVIRRYHWPFFYVASKKPCCMHYAWRVSFKPLIDWLTGILEIPCFFTPIWMLCLEKDKSTQCDANVIISPKPVVCTSFFVVKLGLFLKQR